MKNLSKSELKTITAGFQQYEFVAFLTSNQNVNLFIYVQDNYTAYAFKHVKIPFNEVNTLIQSGKLRELLDASNIQGISKIVGVKPFGMEINL